MKFIDEWIELRKKVLSLNSIESKLSLIAEYWANVPISSRNVILDPYDCSTWPTEWEIISTNNYCRSAIGICMSGTLFFTSIKHELLLVKDMDQSELYLLPYIDNKFILNYNFGKFDVKSNQNLVILEKFERNNKGFIKVIHN